MESDQSIGKKNQFMNFSVQEKQKSDTKEKSFGSDTTDEDNHKTQTKNFFCEKCFLIFETKILFVAHMRNQHITSGPFEETSDLENVSESLKR